VGKSGGKAPRWLSFARASFSLVGTYGSVRFAGSSCYFEESLGLVFVDTLGIWRPQLLISNCVVIHSSPGLLTDFHWSSKFCLLYLLLRSENWGGRALIQVFLAFSKGKWLLASRTLLYRVWNQLLKSLSDSLVGFHSRQYKLAVV
jgi:hypothetical protein